MSLREASDARQSPDTGTALARPLREGPCRSVGARTEANNTEPLRLDASGAPRQCPRLHRPKHGRCSVRHRRRASGSRRWGCTCERSGRNQHQRQAPSLHNSLQREDGMTATVSLPPAPEPYLEAGAMPGDFYAYEELLSETNRQAIASIRKVFRTEVSPIVDDYWARAEFPFRLVEGFAELGLLNWADPASSEPMPSNLFVGITALELAHADPSLATFFGVHSGLAMGTILGCGSEEQKHRWLPAMSRLEKIGAFALTEPHGGSDVSQGLKTTARRDGNEWVIDGTKRWIGNATFAALVGVWARDVET